MTNKQETYIPMQTILINEGQTLKDIATQYLGNAERVGEIALLNDINITDDLVIGAELLIPDVELDKASTINHFKKNNIVPASSIDVAVGEEEEGINYWAIEEDFIIQ